ncbi:MAG: type II toxin-antitoxin system RelB/DinJ family antitoxin [Firmicutes bacterium]|nr:type II toxin-antitoxin system RelB/DinJ family antitoxin [[Eubacterium] siraeum]MCM1487961.1 type II toxin-antitoxin system RelB/DinJ family antitoxin [Bacillota bacterium]
MNRTANIFARVEPEIKEEAESILNQLGIPMSNAVSMFLRQVIIQRGIPFEVKLPNSLPNIANMTEEQLDAELEKGYSEYLEGKAIPADKAFSDIRSEFGI